MGHFTGFWGDAIGIALGLGEADPDPEVPAEFASPVGPLRG
jgi:hypothetical protein